MRLSLVALVASLTAVMAAPSTLEDRASGPSCLASHVNGNCPYLCQGGSGSLHCEGSKCIVPGTMGPYGNCDCKCRYN